jgi:hypothetical protein
MNKLTGLVATTMLVSSGLGLVGLGVASDAQAQIGPAPDYHYSRDVGLLPQDRRYVPRYHWCPGQFWRPEWGFNFDWNSCHDDHHRDTDGGNHNNDFWP